MQSLASLTPSICFLHPHRVNESSENPAAHLHQPLVGFHLDSRRRTATSPAVSKGMKHGPDTWLSPCASGRCRKIVSASVQAATIACPKCHSKPIVPLFDPARGYEDDEAFPSCQASEPLMHEAFACPTCGKRSLRITFAGLWD